MNSTATLRAAILLLPVPADVLVNLLFLLDEITTDLRALKAELQRDLYRRN